MTATFYKISDDARTMGKTLGTPIKTCTGFILKEDTDILNPTLDIKWDSSNNLLNANYVYIDDLSRYYFIKNIRTTSQRLYIECAVDVLESFKNEIVDLDCYVARQQDSDYCERYMNDPFIPFRTLPDITVWGITEHNIKGTMSGTFSPISKTGTWIMAVGCGTIGGN